MNKGLSQQSQQSCATCSRPSQNCQSSLDRSVLTANEAKLAHGGKQASRVWLARMGNEVLLAHAARRGKTDEMALTEQRVLQVMRELSAQYPSTSGEAPSYDSSKPKRSGVRGLIYAARAARAAAVSAWLVLVGTSTPARYPTPQIRPRRLRSSSNKTEFGSELHGCNSPAGSEHPHQQVSR